MSSNIVKHLSLRSIETFRPLCCKLHKFLGLESYGAKDKKRKAEETATNRNSRVKSNNTVTKSDFEDGINRVLSRMSSQQLADIERADSEWYFGGAASTAPTRQQDSTGDRADVGLGIDDFGVRVRVSRESLGLDLPVRVIARCFEGVRIDAIWP